MSPPSPSPDHQPRQIGPYRLGERLGRGGMGEVYRGYDARLDRPVALKRVRPGVGNQEIALRRFQREARAAARLRHPAIVQVHDWVDAEDDGAWLVMELVEGRSLRDIVHDGPLAPARVVALAHDLLEGLAVAHDAGLIHRDLKAENVMVSSVSSAGRGRGEQARILDFGLAKQAMPEAGETQLSEEGKIVGTLSALAPEQVLGQPVDHRADLFALGSMLYELLVGKQAFVGSNPGETLNRICTARQLPVRTLRPDVSVSLSTFVDRLLEKDPRRRPATADEALDLLDRVSTDSLDGSLASITVHDAPTESVVLSAPSTSGDLLPARPITPLWRSWLALALALLIVGVGLAAWRLRPGPPLPDPIYVAVPETIVEAPEGRNLEIAAGVVHSALLRGLIGMDGVRPIEVPPAEADRTVQDLAAVMAVDEMARSRLDCDEHQCSIRLSRLDGRTGAVEAVRTFTGDPRRLLEMDRAIVAHLQSIYGERSTNRTAELDVRPADFETFVNLRERFEAREAGLEAGAVLDELDRLAGRAPRFLELRLFEARVASQRFQEERDETFLKRSRDAINTAIELAPEDPRTWISAARTARISGDLAAAEEALGQLRQLDPGNAEHLFQLALVKEARGQADEAVELARDAADRLPSIGHFLDFADLLLRHGDVDEARDALEQSLERYPEHFNALSRLAVLELTVGDPERSVRLHKELVERSPEPTELTNLGTGYLLLEDYDAAASAFRAALASNPDSPFALLNLADTEMLRGRSEDARELYEDVLAVVRADPRTNRLASIEAQAYGHLGRSEEAVDAIQRALDARRDNPWTAYEAALVYVLIGDRSSALWNGRRALDGGVAPRWFSLPWFSSIHGELIPGETPAT